MTADSPANGTREPVRGRSDRAEPGLPAPTILSICDQLLGEAGRRDHMFAWLRAPGAGADEWLAVDAYYPRARLVVMCRSRPGPHDSLYRELVPAHGLGLLTLDPAVLGNDRQAVQETLAGKFFDLEHLPRERGRRDSPHIRVANLPAPRRLAHERTPPTPPRPRGRPSRSSARPFPEGSCRVSA